MCGCGERTNLAPRDDKRYGIVKGQPIRYVYGHQRFKSPSDVEYVKREDGCWIWQRAVNSAGYGHRYRNGKHRYAHVDAYERANGVVVTATQDVHHTCGEKLCVNPAHLELHTNHEPHRREHGIIRLSQGVADEMRARFSVGGITRREIADEYCVSYSHACNILRGDKWTT